MTRKPMQIADMPTPLTTTPTPRHIWVGRAPNKDETLPWKEPHIRDDLMVQINVKQPEKLKKMVEYAAHRLHISERKFVEEALEEVCRRYFDAWGIEV